MTEAHAADAAIPADVLAAVVAPLLVDNVMAIEPGAPVGGSRRCQAAGCWRSQTSGALCGTHHDRWRREGKPALDTPWDTGPELTSSGRLEPHMVDLGVLPAPLRWEIAFGIDRARHVPEPPHLQLSSLRTIIAALVAARITSLLEPDESAWPAPTTSINGAPVPSGTGTLRVKFLIFTIDELDNWAGRGGAEYEYARDIWRLRRMGSAHRTSGWMLDFTGIDQPWLRRVVKQFVRWRNDTEHSASGLHRDVITLTRLSRALTQMVGPDAAPQQLTRAVIERLLTVLSDDGLSVNGRNMALSSISKFFAVARQRDWIPDVPAGTALYREDFPRRIPLKPRALPEFVMLQLEQADNLAKLLDPRWALLFPLLMQTGLRLNDGLQLGQDCITRDGQGAPYLRYFNHKMKREALVPITDALAASITTRIAAVRDEYSPKSLLFPQVQGNPSGTRAMHPAQAYLAMQKWIGQCDVRNEHGGLVHVTAHQFRHTLGTRLINNDVPQEIIRKILDHTSTEMTAHYARLHDSTVREHWERARKVDVHGDPVTIDESSPLADAAWAKHHLARATMALPNGYCGLPLQQSCPHSNACLTCPVFITTPEFLPQHKEQLEQTRGIIERATQRGQLRLIEMNTKVADNLTRIVTSLETEAPDKGTDDAS